MRVSGKNKLKTTTVKANETSLIKDTQKRILTARGYRIMYDFIQAGIEANGYNNRMLPNAKPISEKIKVLFLSLVFEHGKSEAELIEFKKQLKRIRL
jgi:hypothetical protein